MGMIINHFKTGKKNQFMLKLRASKGCVGEQLFHQTVNLTPPGFAGASPAAPTNGAWVAQSVRARLW